PDGRAVRSRHPGLGRTGPQAGMTPAGFWRRSVAWTLDFLAILAATVALAWPRVAAGWQASASAMQQLSERTADAMYDEMMQGTPFMSMVPRLVHDPRLLEAATVLYAALWQLFLPLLLGYALLALLVHAGGEPSPWQGSPGKRLPGMKVTGMAGERLPWPRVRLRAG